MSKKLNIQSLIKSYKKTSLSLAVIGSHSALDICSGAKEQGFKTLVVAQKGRELTYSKYYKTKGSIGCVDKCITLDKFKEILRPNIQKELAERNAIFVPHRSFEVYLDFDYEAIENKFQIPMFGNRRLLKIEERGIKPNQYDLLQKAKIRIPKIYNNPKKIDRLCLVKVLEKNRSFERAFFLVENYGEYKKITKRKIKEKVFTDQQLKESVIEEFIVGVQVNFNFFYSPITKRLELLGTDTRRQTNIEGLNKIPASFQNQVLNKLNIKYEEAGHITVTVLESMLEKAFSMGERFVEASQKFYPPGIIGPFALQSIIVPGPPKKDIVVFDVSPRVPGSPGTAYAPYTNYLHRKSISVGERIAIEIKQAKDQNKLNEIIT